MTILPVSYKAGTVLVVRECDLRGLSPLLANNSQATPRRVHGKVRLLCFDTVVCACVRVRRLHPISPDVPCYRQASGDCAQMV